MQQLSQQMQQMMQSQNVMLNRMSQFQVMLDTLNRKVTTLELEFHGSIKVDHAR